MRIAYLIFLGLLLIVACEESNTPTHISNEKRMLDECTKACKDVGHEVSNVHAFGIGCTCK